MTDLTLAKNEALPSSGLASLLKRSGADWRQYVI